jgi:hypothetical protein
MSAAEGKTDVPREPRHFRFGTSRHFAAAQQFGRFQSEADIEHPYRV